MNDEFKPIIEQAEKAKTTEQKVDCILTFIKVLSNHIPSMDRRIKRLERCFYFLSVIVLLGLLGANQVALGLITKWIGL